MIIINTNNFVILQGAYNARDLGGYRTADGKYTKKGVFLRSDSTHNLTEEDIKILTDMGLELVIDLRSPNETNAKPSKFLKSDRIKYTQVEMFDVVNAGGDIANIPESMSAMYISFLDDRKESFGKIMRLISDADGLTLFHCAVGKDRTGVLAMLLLSLAGVTDEIIAYDYSLSEKYLNVIFDAQVKQLAFQGITLPKHLFGSLPEQMLITLQYFKETYKNAENYLKICGLSEEEIQKIKNRFI